jgi:hypothetical protein
LAFCANASGEKVSAAASKIIETLKRFSIFEIPPTPLIGSSDLDL